MHIYYLRELIDKRMKQDAHSIMGGILMNENNSTYEITLNKTAMKNLLLKIVVLVILILLPILTLWIGQYALEGFIGPADPTNISWMAIAGVILLWYILIFVIILPYAGRIIDSKYPS